MLTILASSHTGMQAMQMLDRKPPTWTSMTVLLHHFRGLLARNGRRALVVGDDQLDRTAVDAARGVDAVGRHLQTDNGGLAAGGAGARERLLGADLERLGGAEGRTPRRRHQHHGADRAAAPADQGAARDLAAIPDVFGPFLVLPLLSHWKSSHWSCGVGRKAHPASVAGPGVGNAIVAHSPLALVDPWRALGGEFVPLANAILGLVSTVFAKWPLRRCHAACV